MLLSVNVPGLEGSEFESINGAEHLFTTEILGPQLLRFEIVVPSEKRWA
jgi:hypothetical protein